MGVCCDLVQVSEYELEQILVDPSRAEAAFDRVPSRPVPPCREDQLMLFGLPIPRRPRHATAAKLDLEKRWSTLSTWLTGRNEDDGSPLASAISGRELLGSDLPGRHSLIRYLTRPQVAEASRALSDLTPGDLRQRFDPDHPEYLPWSGAWRADPDEIFADLMNDFDQLAAYYRDAARDEMAMLIGYNV